MDNAKLAVHVRKCARPISLVHEPVSRRAAVLFHGYTGYPGELALVAQRLFDTGFDVFVPRYPGHGTTGDDFLSTDGNMWLEEAERVLSEVLDTHDEVSIAGHSMGGIIAVILATRYPIEKGVLFAPALLIEGFPSRVLKPLSLFMRRKAKSWQPDHRYQFFDQRDQDDDVFLGKEYWSWNYPRQLLELDALRKKALKSLSMTTTDFLVLTGALDPVVPPDVGELIVTVGKGRNNWVHLEHATHLIPYDCDEPTRERAMRLAVSWLAS